MGELQVTLLMSPRPSLCALEESKGELAHQQHSREGTGLHSPILHTRPAAVQPAVPGKALFNSGGKDQEAHLAASPKAIFSNSSIRNRGKEMQENTVVKRLGSGIKLLILNPSSATYYVTMGN